MATYLLTTVDNPFNPSTQFAAWYSYDVAAGHHTLEFLGKIVITSDELTDEDNEAAIEEAIDEIVRENVNGLYRKVEVQT